MDYSAEEVVVPDNRASDIDGISNSFSSLLIDVWSCNDDLITYEILSRLTVKEIMRFKCVSKRWRWLIENDPHFIKLHLARSEKRPIFFYVIPLSNYWRAQKENIRYRGYDELLLTTGLAVQGREENTVQIQTIRKTDMFCCDQFLTSINGLICFVDRFEHAVCIYNVSTREVTPWVKSTLLTDEQEKNPGFDVDVDMKLSFGFDPTTMEHKVISISFVSIEEYDGDGDGEDFVICEVLTVGENTWRRIDQVPPVYKFGDQACAVCVSGSVYWMSQYLMWGDWQKDKDLEHIVAFDVGSEKFRTISLPNCIVDKLPNPKSYIHALDRFFVLEVDGRVAFLRRLNSQSVQMRSFNEESSLYNKEIGSKITISMGEKSWTEDTIKLPFSWDRKEQRVKIYSVAGTDQLIIESYEIPNRHMNSVSLYSYSCTKKSWMEIKVSGDPSSVPGSCYTKLCIPLVESVIPVRKKIARRTIEES